ncbi:MAG: LysR family transcriptional regulator substrate-binding protein [Coriobacteriales bacterium]|nr:LysR family transcriptional regulator substrate-binding protein [Coriobacteriales bacterium]
MTELQQLDNELKDYINKQASFISLASTNGLLKLLPPQFLEGFNANNEYGTTANLLVIPTGIDAGCEDALITKACDYAFITEPVHSNGLQTMPFYRDSMFCWVNINDPIASHEYLTPQDFINKSVGLLGDKSNQYNNIKTYIDQVQGPVNTIMCQDMIDVLEIAVKGDGLGIAVRNHIDALNLKEAVCLPIKGLNWSFSLAYREDRDLLPSDDAFLSYISQFKKFYV